MVFIAFSSVKNSFLSVKQSDSCSDFEQSDHTCNFKETVSNKKEKKLKVSQFYQNGSFCYFLAVLSQNQI